MTDSRSSTVVGVFDDYSTAERVARELTNAGIPREAIDVRSNFRTEAAGRFGEEDTANHEGGISGWFHRVFGGEEQHRPDADHYSEIVRRGSAVVCVRAGVEQLDQATAIMNENGAIDVDRRVSQYREEGYREYDNQAPAYTYDEALRDREKYGSNAVRDREGQTSIPVVDEELEVGKRVVQRGGVRVYSQVREVPVEESVTLREEHVSVERRPADRSLRPGEASRFKDQTIEVTESAEVPVVKKRARVREEVVVGKETTERTERVRDTVRKTEVKVDKLAGDREAVADDYAADNYSDDFRRDFERRYASAGADATWDSYAPAYDYGYRMASDPRYHGRQWEDVEDDLRDDYSHRQPGSTWERMKDAVRYGWDKVTGKTR